MRLNREQIPTANAGIDELKLPINRSKSGIRRPVSFQILGYGFVPTYRKGEKGRYQLIVTKKRWKTLKMKLKEITRKTSPMSFDERIIKLKQVTRGWINYFNYASICQKLSGHSGVFINCLFTAVFMRASQERGSPRQSRLLLGILAGWATRLAAGRFCFQSFFFHFCCNYFCLCVGAAILFDKFWSCGWHFARLGNVYGCEGLAINYHLKFVLIYQEIF